MNAEMDISKNQGDQQGVIIHLNSSIWQIFDKLEFIGTLKHVYSEFIYLNFL